MAGGIEQRAGEKVLDGAGVAGRGRRRGPKGANKPKPRDSGRKAEAVPFVGLIVGTYDSNRDEPER